jgi:hypothetical protein
MLTKREKYLTNYQQCRQAEFEKTINKSTNTITTVTIFRLI